MIFEKLKNIRIIYYVLTALLILAIILVLVAVLPFKLKYQEIESSEYIYEEGVEINIDDGEYLSFNDSNHSMRVDLETTNIIINDKKNNKIFQTLSVDENATPLYQEYQKTPLIITYMFEGWKIGKQLDAYTTSIKNRNFRAYAITNGIRIVYDIAIQTPLLSWFPRRLDNNLYNELLNITDIESEKEVISYAYRLQGSGNYQIISSIDTARLTLLYEVFYNKYGLTDESLLDLNRAFGYDKTFIEKPRFIVPVEYVMSEGQLVARVISQKIEEKGIVLADNKTMFITSIDLLPYFYCQKNSNESFVFAPDGSGAIINLNTIPTATTRYSKAIYDGDKILSKNYETNENEESILMPIYGITNGLSGVFAVVEDGAASTNINIARSTSSLGASSGYTMNCVYPTYNYRYLDQYRISESVTIDIFGPLQNDTIFQVRYFLLSSSERLTYMNMVNTYKDYLFKEKIKINENPMVQLDVIGGINTKKFFVGIPYDKVSKLTSFNDLLGIMKELKNEEIRYNYLGWSEGGMFARSSYVADFEKALGSSNDYKLLNEYINSNSITLDYNLNFLEVYKNADGFNNSEHGMKLIGNYTATYYQYNSATMEFNSKGAPKYIMSANYLNSAIDKYLNSHDINSISLNDLGNTIVGDFSSNISASTYEKAVIEALIKLSDKSNITLNNPFAYAFLYAKHIMNIPLSSSGEFLFSYDIPFLQLVLNGYLTYTLKNNNQIDFDDETILLKAIESGSGISYLITKENSMVTKDTTDFNFLYNTEFALQKNAIVDTSAKLRNLYDLIGTSNIINHQRLTNSLVLITYENNKKVILNYGNSDSTYQGLSVTAKGYEVIA